MIIYLQMMDNPEERSKFEQIYLEYRGLMFHVANEILHDEQDAEDAVHQAFLNVAEHIQKIGEPKCPKTKGYVVTVAENKAIDLYRRRKRHQMMELNEDAPGLQVIYEGENTLTACIMKLPARYREAILLRYVQGYSVKEMSSILRLSFAAASKLDQRAKAKLKDLYEKGGQVVITEEMLKTAAAEADRVIRDSLPAPEECEHEFSQSFQKKMRRISRRAKHPVLYKLVQSAACFVLVVILLGGTWLTVDAEAREAFIRWVKETYSTYSVYHFEGADSGQQTSEEQTSEEQTSAEYSLAWIPDGYTEWETESIGDGVYVIYVDDSGKMLTFGYLPSSSAAYMFVETTDYTQQSTYVGNVPADFYLSHSPDKSNSIVWTSPDGETAFYLDGFFSKEELIEMAENVLPYDAEKIKNYMPEWLPDGYEQSKQTLFNTLKSVVYTNSDGQWITFTCTFGDDVTDTVLIEDYSSVSAVMVGNVQADFYQASREGEGNALVWHSDTDGCLFYIGSPLPEDVLVKIAESVVEK